MDYKEKAAELLNALDALKDAMSECPDCDKLEAAVAKVAALTKELADAKNSKPNSHFECQGVAAGLRASCEDLTERLNNQLEKVEYLDKANAALTAKIASMAEVVEAARRCRNSQAFKLSKEISYSEAWANLIDALSRLTSAPEKPGITVADVVAVHERFNPSAPEKKEYTPDMMAQELIEAVRYAVMKADSEWPKEGGGLRSRALAEAAINAAKQWNGESVKFKFIGGDVGIVVSTYNREDSCMNKLCLENHDTRGKHISEIPASDKKRRPCKTPFPHFCSTPTCEGLCACGAYPPHNGTCPPDGKPCVTCGGKGYVGDTASRHFPRCLDCPPSPGKGD